MTNARTVSYASLFPTIDPGRPCAMTRTPVPDICLRCGATRREACQDLVAQLEGSVTDEPTRCEACGEPATRTDVEGVPLCEGDYQDLLVTWRMEGFQRGTTLRPGNHPPDGSGHREATTGHEPEEPASGLPVAN